MIKNNNIFRKLVDQLNNEFIIPEYKIELLNKSKKIIKTIENFELIVKEKQTKEKKNKKKDYYY